MFCWAYTTELGEYGFLLKTPASLELLDRLFHDPQKHIIGHNIKFDLHVLLQENIDVLNAECQIHDTVILTKIYHGQLFEYSLRTLAKRFLGRVTDDKDEIEVWVQQNRKRFQQEFGRNPNFSDAPTEIVKRRVLWDVESTLMLFLKLIGWVNEHCRSLYETEQQLIVITTRMEWRGVEIDITRAQELKAEAEKGIEILQTRINALLGEKLLIRHVKCTVKGCKKKKKIKTIFSDRDIPPCCPVCEGGVMIVEEYKESLNTNSSAIEVPSAWIQLGFELKYKTPPKKGKKGKAGSMGGRWSFNEYSMIRYSHPLIARIIRDEGEQGWEFNRFMETLQKTVKENKLPRRYLMPAYILKLNQLKKMVVTYYDHFLTECVDHYVSKGRRYGTLHAHFNQCEADTGRFSSSGPNLQNMPRLLGPRECFVPRGGKYNWHFDYEQVEMKFFVHFAEDSAMAAAIDADIHAAVAAEIYGIPLDQVTSEQRKRAKAINFGIIYGAGAEKIAATLTERGLLTTVAEATRLVNNYHRKFPSVRRLTAKLKRELLQNGYIANPFGRRYHIDQNRAYIALNYDCQGTSADQIKSAMVKVYNYLKQHKLLGQIEIIMQVHDELVIEMPKTNRDTARRIKAIMEDRKGFYIPITVDAEIVDNRWSKKRDPSELGFASLN